MRFSCRNPRVPPLVGAASAGAVPGTALRIPAGRAIRITGCGSSAAVLAALALAVAAGCGSYVSGNGVYSEQDRTVGDFQGVRVEDGVGIVAKSGAALEPVRVIADENGVPLVRTDLVPAGQDPGFAGTTLHVWVDGEYGPIIAPRVVVSVPSLTRVHARDASPVQVSQADALAFSVDASDTSSVTLAGTGGLVIRAKVGGSAHLDASGYPTLSGDVDLDGYATATLDASVVVIGTVVDHATLVNDGGPCFVTTSGSATVHCGG